jgi:hypothetical protein
MTDAKTSPDGDDGYQPDEVFKYQPLNYDTTEQRFLILHPFAGDKNDEEAVVRCSIETVPLADAKPFIAVRNSRGYRLLMEAIYIDDKPLPVSVAVERFLRNFRRYNEPVRLWLRHVCLIEGRGEESVKYWTRPFFERMYELATEVVDMNVYNTNLMETGKILPVIDDRYMKWRKEWHSVEASTPLPKVYPIRVGNKPFLTDPKDRYAYVPLDPVAKEIRLIVLHASEDPNETVKIHLAHAPMKTDVGYQAISYTWGKNEATKDIIVTGQLFAVTESLERFLRVIRGPKNPVVLWIDAICIDQSNIFERDRQLPRMAAIYDTAAFVLASLGDMDKDAELAMRLIPKLQMPMLRWKEEEKRWDVGAAGEFSQGELARLCLATYRFLTRPYFRRVWILQEIAWATNPVAICGSDRGFSFDEMDHAARNLQDLIEYDSELAEIMQKAAGESQPVQLDDLDYIRKMWYFRHIMSSGNGTAVMYAQVNMDFLGVSPACAGLLESLILARGSQATEPLDKLFGLWNLAADGKGLDFEMTYTDSLPVSFTKCARAWMLQHKSLDIIAAAECDPRSAEFYESAPSWCPDWSASPTTSSMVRRDFIPRRLMMAMDALNGPLYSADGGIKPDDFDDDLFSFDGDTLLCTGIVLDKLNGFISAVEPGQAFPVFAHVTSQVYGDPKEPNPYEAYRQALFAMCVGDVPSTWPLRPKEEGEFDEDAPHKRYKGNRDTARHFYRYVTDIGSMEAWTVLKKVLRGRVLGFTSKGYMCLLPHWVLGSHEAKEPGWVLAVLAGCSTPVALRQREDGTYKMAGSVFVQGWMEGEFIKEMMGAESPKEFWLPKMKEEKIRIR